MYSDRFRLSVARRLLKGLRGLVAELACAPDPGAAYTHRLVRQRLDKVDRFLNVPPLPKRRVNP